MVKTLIYDKRANLIYREIDDIKEWWEYDDENNIVSHISSEEKKENVTRSIIICNER